MRYIPAEPTRRCRCGAEAPLTKIIVRTSRGIPTGTHSTHRCPRCGRAFTVIDVWGLVFRFVALCLFGALTALFLLHPPGGLGPMEGGNAVCVVVLILGALVAGVGPNPDATSACSASCPPRTPG